MRANEISPKKLVVFDIDDTLVHTQTKVHVVKDGEIINSLNSHDFTHYKLKPGESFDFEDFRNAREFFEKSKPIIPMMQQLRQDIATGNKVVMVTARADFDDKELFLDTFRKYGIDMSKVHVYRAGNSKEGSTEDRKKAIIKRLLDQDNYSKAIMYDDAKPNLHTFIELKKDHPRTRFYAWHVSLEGKASEYMREGLVTERKRKRRPRWAAYGPGPFGGYGYAAGYSGVGSAGDGGGVGEASYAGNIGAMEMAKFFQKADDQQKKILKDLIAKGKRGLAWKLIQDVTGVKLQGAEFQTDEGWKDTLANIGIAGAIAAGGAGGMAAKQSLTSPDSKPSISQPADNTGQRVSGKITYAPKKQEPKKEIVNVSGTSHEALLKKAAMAAGIKGTELAAFLSQTAHETMNFQHMVEIGNDRAFRKYDPKHAPKKAKALGNTKVGDGAKYKGRGYIQLTGRYNYKRAGEALGLPLEQQPELVEKPEVAAKVAVWFWELRVQPNVDNFKDVTAVTKPINPGLRGLADRKEKFQAYKVALI